MISEQAQAVWSKIGGWLREPLVHFVLIGAGLFLLLQAFSHSPGKPAASGEIVVSEDDLRRIVMAWAAQRGRPPVPSELEALVDQEVHEEVLAREATAMGLDRGDAIIRRRLAQKMDFLAADIATLQDPSEVELRSWYAANSERFAMPPRASFHHLYFSFDRGPRARGDATGALEKISARSDGSARPAADPFMFHDYYSERTPEQVVREFGAEFAKALFQLKPGIWSDPVRSGYGWHLVFVDALAPGRIPTFDEIAPDVRKAWLEYQQRFIRDKAYETMRARYKVVVPDIPVSSLVSQKSPALPQYVPEPQ